MLVLHVIQRGGDLLESELANEAGERFFVRVRAEMFAKVVHVTRYVQTRKAGPLRVIFHRRERRTRREMCEQSIHDQRSKFSAVNAR